MNQIEPKSEQSPAKKRKRIPVKYKKFLIAYAELGDVGKAYIKAGFKANNRHTALNNGWRLMAKLDKEADYLEIFDQVGLGDREIATIMSGLIRHKDPRIQTQTLNIATKCKGWQKDILDVAPGATIVIGVKKEPQPGKEKPKEIEKKEKGPITVTD